MYLLGYIPADNRLYLGDKELNVVSFSLLLSVLEYQTAVMRKDFDTADKVNDQCCQIWLFEASLTTFYVKSQSKFEFGYSVILATFWILLKFGKKTVLNKF